MELVNISTNYFPFLQAMLVHMRWHRMMSYTTTRHLSPMRLSTHTMMNMKAHHLHTSVGTTYQHIHYLHTTVEVRSQVLHHLHTTPKASVQAPNILDEKN